jgi:nucleotide-binding universal stress UspA family protein
MLIASGNTSEEIVRVAEEHCADLIVMGKSTGSILGSDLVGSTARRVARYTNIPVLIVPNTP